VLRVLLALARARFPLRAVRAMVRPPAARARIARLHEEIAALARVTPSAGPAERLDGVDRVLLNALPHVATIVVPCVAPALGGYVLAGRLLGDLATDDERQAILRALPHNPTTEMDLALWALAQQVRGDAPPARAVLETPPDRLARAYRSGELPHTLQEGLTALLRAYGHRAVAEIDLGLPRWSEDPTHLLGVLANYLRLEEPERAPDVQFRRAAAAADAMVAALGRRAARRGRLRGALVRFLLGRTRALAGLREVPKFFWMLAFARARAHLQAVGEELARAGRLAAADDIFFLTLPEARAALAGADLRAPVRERRAGYDQELHRRHLPRVLLSDGTEPTAPTTPATAGDGALRGTPASAGVATGPARVILDPTGARLEPGEILVAPSTDPGWTPLFLTAGGLVMEMGGMMSHGAVVAREYGIPAVVGVLGATAAIETGREISVDGSRWVVTL
jgi:phosphohistidine swiveling domain-containing protein